MTSTNVRIIYQLDKICFSPVLLQATFGQTVETSFMTFFATIFIFLVILVVLYVKFPSVQNAVTWAAAGQQIAAAKDEVIQVKDQLIRAKDKQIERNDRDIEVNSKAAVLDLALGKKIIIMELQGNTAPLPQHQQPALNVPITGDNGLHNPKLPLFVTPLADAELPKVEPKLDGHEEEREKIERRLRGNIEDKCKDKYTFAVTTTTIRVRRKYAGDEILEEVPLADFEKAPYFSAKTNMYFLGCGYSKCNAIIITENKEKKYCCDKNHKAYASQERKALSANEPQKEQEETNE